MRSSVRLCLRMIEETVIETSLSWMIKPWLPEDVPSSQAHWKTCTSCGHMGIYHHNDYIIYSISIYC